MTMVPLAGLLGAGLGITSLAQVGRILDVVRGNYDNAAVAYNFGKKVVKGVKWVNEFQKARQKGTPSYNEWRQGRQGILPPTPTKETVKAKKVRRVGRIPANWKTPPPPPPRHTVAARLRPRSKSNKQTGRSMPRKYRRKSRKAPARRSRKRAGVYKKTQKRKRTAFKRKTKRTKFTSFNTNGSTLRIERGGVWDDKQCIYIGHGVATTHLVSATWRAFFSMVFKKIGVQINNWDDKPASGGQVMIEYRQEILLGNNANIKFDISENVTYELGAKYFADRWRHKFALGYAASPFSWYFGERAGAAVTDATVDPTSAMAAGMRCSGWFNELYVEYNVNSMIRVQNQTIAGPTTKADLTIANQTDLLGARENMFNMQANPLRGKLYQGSGRNGFLEDSRRTNIVTQQAAPAASFIVHTEKGIISNKGEKFMSKAYYKPPYASQFEGRVTSKPVSVMPGAWLEHGFNFKMKMSFTKAIEKFPNIFNNVPIDYEITPVGKYAMFALEKKIDSRTGSNNPTVQWELNQTYQARMFVKQSTRSTPIIDVVTGPTTNETQAFVP